MLILMIAAGILLAVVLLPFLGPLVLLALGVGGALLIGYLILMSIGAVMALFGLAKEAPAGARKLVGDIQAARAQSFSGQVAADPSYAQGTAAIGELLTAAKLRGLPGLWHGHILRERFGNCRHAGLFRVEDGLNRQQLEKYLQTAAARCAGPDAGQGETLSQQILACYDRLCAAHVPKK